jgi:hypothetical protein
LSKKKDTQIVPLKEKTVNIEYTEKERLQFYEDLRNIIRSCKGMNLQDDPFYNLVQKNDIRETTIIENLGIWSHTGMRLASVISPKMLGFWEQVADMEDHYQKSEEGKQYSFLIAMVQSKNQESTIQNVIQPLQAPIQKQPKKHFWSKEKTEE